MIQSSCEYLKIELNAKKASSLDINQKRTDKVIALCESIGATSYITPEGAKEYLTEDQFELKTKVALSFQNYHAKAYKQAGTLEFFSHLSIIDVLMNIGWDGCREYILG